MITIDTSNLSSLKEQTTNENLPFPGFARYSIADKDVLRKEKRFNQNLEDVYDRLKNNNFKISSRLGAYRVSDHLELAYSQITPTDHAEATALGDEGMMFIDKPIHC